MSDRPLFNNPIPGEVPVSPKLSPAQAAKRIRELEESIKLKEGLPHKFGWKWYPWARIWSDSRNKTAILCAANQISKSSTQIRTAIEWATNKELWEELWPKKPKQFWYLYPTKTQINNEWVTKWSEFMPAGEFENSPEFGWKVERNRGDVLAVHFNSGVHIYFKSYAQDTEALQTGTCDALFCFVAGHKVSLERGEIPIELVRKGDMAWTRGGKYEQIQDTYSRKANVISRALSSGEVLTGTPDHRFWTKNRGYVAFVDLLPSDTLDILSLCKEKKPSSTRALNTIDTRGILSRIGTILATGLSSFTELFGSTCGALFLKWLRSITRTKIRQTIKFLTWSLFQEPSIRGCISAQHGQAAPWGKEEKWFVWRAISLLLRAPLRKLLASSARNSVGAIGHLSLQNVNIALKRLWDMNEEESVFVLPGVLVQPFRRSVYNINVKNTHNYYLSRVNISNCDEELPMEHYDELKMRLSASNGYFRMVFTATLGQDFWRRALDPGEGEKEELVGALKMTVSLYDAMFYEDGTQSIWTEESIARVRANCSTEQEVLKRVYGKFILIGGRVLEAFDMKRHVKEQHAIPPSWLWYAAVDPGSGGDDGHPAGIVFVAVRPDYRAARVPLCWRGDKIQTTNGDVLKKYVDMKKENKITIVQAAYDWSSKDFEIQATRNGEAFTKAEKSHEIGEQTLNTLFKYDALLLYDNAEVMKLAGECATLKRDTAKKNKKDNLYDPLRYACNLIPFDWSFITHQKSEYEEAPLEARRSDLEQQIIDRRKAFDDIDREESLKIEEEIADANDSYEGF